MFSRYITILIVFILFACKKQKPEDVNVGQINSQNSQIDNRASEVEDSYLMLAPDALPKIVVTNQQADENMVSASSNGQNTMTFLVPVEDPKNLDEQLIPFLVNSDEGLFIYFTYQYQSDEEQVSDQLGLTERMSPVFKRLLSDPNADPNVVKKWTELAQMGKRVESTSIPRVDLPEPRIRPDIPTLPISSIKREAEPLATPRNYEVKHSIEDLSESDTTTVRQVIDVQDDITVPAKASIDDPQIKAAITIQAGVRGFLARKKYSLEAKRVRMLKRSIAELNSQIGRNDNYIKLIRDNPHKQALQLYKQRYEHNLHYRSLDVDVLQVFFTKQHNLAETLDAFNKKLKTLDNDYKSGKIKEEQYLLDYSNLLDGDEFKNFKAAYLEAFAIQKRAVMAERNLGKEFEEIAAEVFRPYQEISTTKFSEFGQYISSSRGSPSGDLQALSVQIANRMELPMAEASKYVPVGHPLLTSFGSFKSFLSDVNEMTRTSEVIYVNHKIKELFDIKFKEEGSIEFSQMGHSLDQIDYLSYLLNPSSFNKHHVDLLKARLGQNVVDKIKNRAKEFDSDRKTKLESEMKELKYLWDSRAKDYLSNAEKQTGLQGQLTVNPNLANFEAALKQLRLKLAGDVSNKEIRDLVDALEGLKMRYSVAN